MFVEYGLNWTEQKSTMKSEVLRCGKREHHLKSDKCRKLNVKIYVPLGITGR
jgi:hypothetical protein